MVYNWTTNGLKYIFRDNPILGVVPEFRVLRAFEMAFVMFYADKESPFIYLKKDVSDHEYRLEICKGLKIKGGTRIDKLCNAMVEKVERAISVWKFIHPEMSLVEAYQTMYQNLIDYVSLPPSNKNYDPNKVRQIIKDRSLEDLSDRIHELRVQCRKKLEEVTRPEEGKVLDVKESLEQEKAEKEKADEDLTWDNNA